MRTSAVPCLLFIAAFKAFITQNNAVYVECFFLGKLIGNHSQIRNMSDDLSRDNFLDDLGKLA